MFGFRPLIMQPTRVQTTRRGTWTTLIDNIFLNDLESFSTAGNISTSISDHFPQFCPIYIFDTPNKRNNTIKFGRTFKNFNQDEFQNDIKILIGMQILIIKIPMRVYLFS